MIGIHKNFKCFCVQKVIKLKVQKIEENIFNKYKFKGLISLTYKEPIQMNKR